MAETINAYAAQEGDDTERLEQVAEHLVGEPAVPVVKFLRDKEHISEFIIAEELDLEIHEARSRLYNLLEHNLVSFKRKKDETKGWYICYWDLNDEVIEELYDKIKEDRLSELRERLEEETENVFYMCDNACMRLSFEEAMEHDFKCLECGQIMEQQDNERTVSFLKEKIQDLEAQMA